jgi:hypothetical protein
MCYVRRPAGLRAGAVADCLRQEGDGPQISVFLVTNRDARMLFAVARKWELVSGLGKRKASGAAFKAQAALG